MSKFTEFVKGLETICRVKNPIPGNWNWDVAFRVKNIKDSEYGKKYNLDETVIHIYGVFDDRSKFSTGMSMSTGMMYPASHLCVEDPWKGGDIIVDSPSFPAAFEYPTNKKTIKHIYNVFKHKEAEIEYTIEEFDEIDDDENEEMKKVLIGPIEGLLKIVRE